MMTITLDQGFEDPTIINPGGEAHGPFDWLESGVRIAGFWAVDIGRPATFFQQGHLHPHLLPANSFDPALAEIEGRWTPFSTPTALFDPWFTLPISGFDDVKGVFITQTAGGMKVDAIVLDVAPVGGGTPVPLSRTFVLALVLLLAATGVAVLTGQGARA